MKIENLDQFAAAFGTLLKGEPTRTEIIRIGREMLSELVRYPGWLQPILTKLVLDRSFLDAQWQSIDPNEIQIYRSSDKSFSIRAYIWEPGVVYPIHDHGAWGVVGGHISQVKERKFLRTDDGTEESFAALRQTAETILSPGDTTFVLPMDEGIHQMEAPGDRTAVTIHVYGAPVRKGFIRYFSPESNFVQRMYAPGVAKKIFAIRTLGSIPEAWAEEVLSSSIRADVPDYVRKECSDSLGKLANC